MPVKNRGVVRRANRSVRLSVLLLLALPALSLAAQLADAYEIRSIELLESTAATLPLPDAPWQSLQLPYQKSFNQVDAGYAWFRFTVPRPEGVEPQSLYINNHMYGITVWLNGEQVGGSDAPEGKLAMGWNLPLLLRLPASSWRDGDNEFLIRLQLHRFTNVLASVYLGDHAQLWRLCQQRDFTQGRLSLFSFYICLVMGVFMLGMWVQRRADTQYLWYGLSALCWAVPMLYMAVRYSPIRHDWFLVLTMIAINFYGVASVRFLHRLLGLHRPQLEQWHLLSMLVLSLVETLASADWLMPVSLLADVNGLLVLCSVMLQAWLLARGGNNWEAKLVIAMVLVAFVLFSRDIYEFLSSTRSNTMVSSGTYMQYAFPIILAVFFAILTRRFVVALQQSEMLNRELEQRVAAIDAQLQASYAANRALELKEATEQQKRKIYRDLHDDVGARLVSIMHASESNAQAKMAQSALASLRETVSSGNFQDEMLAELLADTAHNIEARCHNSELSFTATVPEVMPPIIFSGNRCYHFKRILQEVVSNIIKHAGATEVGMRVEIEADMLLIALTDDGTGLPPEVAAGNGMTNIRYRAREISGEAHWLPNPAGAGCRFCLSLALAEEAPIQGLSQ